MKARSPFPSREEFAYWLSLLDPTAEFSVSRTCSACPLAMFLKSAGFSWPQITGHGYWTTRDFPDGRPLPEWALKFMRAIDAQAPGPVNITASKAIAILRPASTATDSAA